MAMILKESTASQEILLGRFVDSTDGDTAENGLTINNTDIKLFKHGATAFTNKNSGGAILISDGYYYAVLDATDTNTVGNLEVHVKMAGALAIKREYVVAKSEVYDSLYSSSAAGYQVPIWSSAVATVNLSGTTVSAVTNRVTANTDQIAGVAVSTSTAQIGVNVVNAGNTAWGSGAITAASIASSAITDSKIATAAITAAKFAPSAIDATAIASNAITSSKIAADAIGATQLAADAVSEIVGAIWTTTLPGSYTGSQAGKILSDALVDTNEMQLDLANGGRLDLLFDAIKAKADSMTFTVAGFIDSNIQYVNDVQVIGTGTPTTDPWRPV